MSAVSIGPLLFATERFAAILGIGAFFLALPILARLFKSDAARYGFGAVVAGLLAARLGHVLLNWQTFIIEPLRVFFVWQGGFELFAGLAGLILYGALRVKRWSGAATLTGSTAVGFGIWGMVLLLTRYSVGVPLTEQPLMHQVTGEAIALSSFAGKPMVINLWASWCPPCVRELPLLSEVAAQTPEVTFAFVNQGDPVQTIAEFLRQQDIVLDVSVVDETWQTSTHYGAKGLPTTLFIDAQGRVVDTVVGEVSPESLAAHLDLIVPD